MLIPQQISIKEKNQMTYINGPVHETAEIPPVATIKFADGTPSVASRGGLAPYPSPWSRMPDCNGARVRHG
jgi:hypothetical protein